MAGGRARRSSEALAAKILEDSGFEIVEFSRKVIINGVEVAEIDIVAKKGSDLYAVEVKAGIADVNSVRQAYVNAVVAGMKPLIISRGIDEPARELAKKMGVNVIVLPDELLITMDDLREAVEDAVYSALIKLLQPISKCEGLGNNDLEIIRAIALSHDMASAARSLGISIEELALHISRLRRQGLIPRDIHGFKALRLASLVLMLCISFKKHGSTSYS